MTEQWVPKKPNFGPPPPGYVPGIGRGATGFITRSDLGPAARAASMVQVKQSQVEDAAYSDNKYNQWEGYKGALFSREQVDEEDKQADEAFDFCERRMQERRLKYRQESLKKELAKQKQDPNNVPISEQYTDLKRELAKVTEEEWANIPESQDKSIKKRKKEKYTPVPDSMLVNYLNPSTTKSEVETDANQDFRDAKSMLLKCNLEKAENQARAQSSVDKIGYLTHLDTSRVDEEMVGDIKRARLLHRAALNSNPRNSDIWLSAARIQELDGKMLECRAILRKALEYVSSSQDIWIELARVERAEESKNVLIEGLRHIPSSEKIWLTIARKEDGDKQMKSKVLRKALENIPQSTRLWKELIELSDLEEAKKLMYRAVECLPKQIDLWIGLAKLQVYEKAKQVLNQARKANPLNLAIWISAAKLEETQSSDRQKAVNKIEVIITKGREILKKNGNSVSREDFLQEALFCEKSGNLITCESIVKSVISLGLTEEELNHSLFKDTDLYEKQFESIYTTRYLYKYGVLATKNPRLFEKLLEFEQRLAISDLRSSLKKEERQSELFESMKFGLTVFPDSVEFWLTMIDRLIQNKDYQEAENVIKNATEQIPMARTQKLHLKRVQILQKKGLINDARGELESIRNQFPNSPVSAVQSVWFEYHLGNFESAWELCSKIFKDFPKTEQIWQLALRIKRKIGAYQECKKLAEKAANEFPQSIRLWELYVQLQLQYNFDSRARAILDKALMKNPKNEQIYLQMIELEIRYGDKKQVSSVLAKALKDCPKSGEIWAIAILKEPHNARKKKASVAVEQCGTNSAISCSIGKLFWKDNKVEKARKWLEDALHHDKTNGDYWAYYLKFIKEHFSLQYEKLLTDFKEVGKISQGRKWRRAREENEEGWRLSEEEVLGLVMDGIGQQIHELD